MVFNLQPELKIIMNSFRNWGRRFKDQKNNRLRRRVSLRPPNKKEETLKGHLETFLKMKMSGDQVESGAKSSF